ncbi:MAG: TspO/MBR family protein [Rhodothalassiaceae bacterium]
MSSAVALAVFLAANFAAASTGAIFKPGRWYRDLDKPSWTPPDWLFPIAWSILYVMIAVAGWLVWKVAGWAAWPAYLIYGLQLALNAGWSAVFFGLRRPDWAMLEVGFLWTAIVLTILAFFQYSALAGWLLVPYAVWASFAAVLNAAIWTRNRPFFRRARAHADRHAEPVPLSGPNR